MSLLTAKHDNEQLLGSRHEELRSGKPLDLLEPFARAYLGLFYEIDGTLPPEQRLALLANEKLVAAILDGFVAALSAHELPAISSIARAHGQSMPLGYVMLAGIDRLLVNKKFEQINLSDDVLRALLAFHYTHTSYTPAPWAEQIMLMDKLSAPVLNEIWRTYIDKGEQVLPAYLRVFRSNDLQAVKQKTVIPLLRHWHNCRKKYLKELIAIAFQYANHDELLEVAREKVNSPDELDEYRYIVWYATAFLSNPEEFGQNLATHVGRVKQKVLPLLDFSIELLTKQDEKPVNVSAMGIAQLLRIVAPVFPPQAQSGYYNPGLDVNSQNVMKLMYRLACDSSQAGAAALKWLKKARVMKIYSGSLKYIGELQKAGADPAFVVPDFAAFVTTLLEKNELTGRSNRFDLK